MKAKDKGRLPPFVPLLVDTLDSPAWLALSHGARSLYIALRRRYSTNFKNNGKIYLATRDAAKELGSGLEEIGNWYRELQHYGFIVMTTGGCLGVEGVGKAPHWRLTEVGHMKELPTKDFLRWDGTKFRRRTPLRKQNPDTESRISSDTESRIITSITTSGVPLAPSLAPSLTLWTAPELTEITDPEELEKFRAFFDCVSAGSVYRVRI